MVKIARWTGIVLVIAFVVIQFFRPDRTNPPVDESKTIFARVTVPDSVRNLLQNSCADCHSNETRWPWYSNISPVSWIIANDVKEARSHLNLSEFDRYKSLRAVGKLDMMSEMMEDGKMPLPEYVFMHPAARVSKAQIEEFNNWADSVRDTLASEE
jgi:Haem-binding domain